MVKEISNITKKIIILIVIFQISFIPISYAGFWDNIKDNADDFIQTGKDQSTTDDGPGVNQDNIDSMMNQVYNALLLLGVVVSVLIGAILGIQFMIGSVEQQAKIKEMLLPYATGCIVTFGAFGIWKIMMVLLSSV